jgi:uncharacterized membrane protein
LNIETILLVITGTLTALLAGLFFGFSVAINGALHRLKDVEYVRAMQSINIVILNPIFFLSFMGPVALLPLTAFLFRGEAAFVWLVAASVLYIVGTFGLTIGGNVPLNDKLAKVDTTRVSDKEITDARAQFEHPWNRLHNIRTVAAIAATALLFIACLARS